MWKQVVDTLVRTAASRGSLLVSSTIVSDDGSTLLVTLPKGSGFALKMLERQDVRSTVDPVVRQVFGARHVKFAEAGQGESSGTAAPRRARKTTPAPKAQPQPQPEPQPRPQPAPAPAPPQPAQPAYAAPWEAPAQTEPPYEEVPYDDASAASFDETDVAPVSQPAAPRTPERHRAAPSPAPKPKPEPEKGQEPGPKPAQAAPKPEPPAPAEPSQPAPADAGSARFANIPDDIPPDLTAVIESAFDVFGSGVKVSKVSKRPASGADA